MNGGRLEAALLVASTALLVVGAGFAAVAVLGCEPFGGGCPSAWIRSLHPLFRGVRFAALSAGFVGAAFFGFLMAGAARRF